MNLAKLLSASTSFFGGGEKPGYRQSRGGSLPKFNEGRNPFGYKPALERPTIAPVPAPAAKPAQKTPPPYAFKPAAKAAATAPKVVPLEGKPARQGWATRLNPFRAAEPAVAQMPRAVQAELSLNSVKVLHNDLADADVEVVPVKSRTEAPGTAPVLPPSRRTWGLVAETLVKS